MPLCMSELFAGSALKTFHEEDVDDFAQLTHDVINKQLIVGARYDTDIY